MDAPAATARPASVALSVRLAVATLFFANGALSGAWFVTIPAVKDALSFSAGTLGMALFGAPLGALVAMPVAGLLAGRIGSRRVAAGGAVLFCLSLPLLVSASGFVGLFGALVVYGIGNGALDVGMNAEAVAVESRLGRSVMAWYHGMWSVGGMAGSLTAGGAAALAVAPAVYLPTAAVVGVLALGVAVWRLPVGRGAVVGVGLARPRLILLGLGFVAFCALMIEGAMVDWTAVYMTEDLATGPGRAAIALAAFSAMMAAGRLIGDRLIDRFGPIVVVEAGAAAILGGLLLGIAAASPLPAIAGFGIVGAGVACAVPIAFGAAGRVPGLPSGVAISAVTTMGYCGFLVGPPTIGLMADASSLGAALGVVCLLAVAMAAIAPVALPVADRRR